MSIRRKKAVGIWLGAVICKVILRPFNRSYMIQRGTSRGL